MVTQIQMDKSVFILEIKNILGKGFPGGAVVKNPPANAGDRG